MPPRRAGGSGPRRPTPPWAWRMRTTRPTRRVAATPTPLLGHRGHTAWSPLLPHSIWTTMRFPSSTGISSCPISKKKLFLFLPFTHSFDMGRNEIPMKCSLSLSLFFCLSVFLCSFVILSSSFHCFRSFFLLVFKFFFCLST